MKLGCRVVLFCTTVICAVVFFSTRTPGADSAIPSTTAPIKAYNPFDEAVPRTPREILDDKRLNRKVKVFVKDKNLNQLFADLTTKTGVKLTVARSISGERAIIYFHSRPLRDVMTEISGLYGYYWLPKGKPGAYSYELFEDIRHSRLREQRKKERRDRQNSLLLALAAKMVDGGLDDSVSQRLIQANPDAEWNLKDPAALEYAKILQGLGTDFLCRALADGKAKCAFRDLPPDVQKRLYERDKASFDMINASSSEAGEAPSLPVLTTIADMMDAEIYVNRHGGGDYMSPVFSLGTMVQGTGCNSDWPDSSISEKDYRGLIGWSVPPEVSGDAGVPVEPAITKRELSWVVYSEGLRFGDVLQAIAEQSSRDVIADYRFQDAVRGLLGAIEKEPLNKVTRLVCSTYNSACRADAQTIRFRRNDWFLNDPPVEPPAELIARCWADIEQKGSLQFDDILDLAFLPKAQQDWYGFWSMPGASTATGYSSSWVRLWAILNAEQIETASSKEGLPVSDLSAQQWQSLIEWSRSPIPPVAPESLEGSVIHVAARAGTRGGTKPFQITRVEIVSGGKSVYHNTVVPPTPLDEETQKMLIAQRKADKDAEKIELIP
jgi:hypothetical protein